MSSDQTLLVRGQAASHTAQDPARPSRSWSSSVDGGLTATRRSAASSASYGSSPGAMVVTNQSSDPGTAPVAQRRQQARPRDRGLARAGRADDDDAARADAAAAETGRRGRPPAARDRRSGRRWRRRRRRGRRTGYRSRRWGRGPAHFARRWGSAVSSAATKASTAAKRSAASLAVALAIALRHRHGDVVAELGQRWIGLVQLLLEQLVDRADLGERAAHPRGTRRARRRG